MDAATNRDRRSSPGFTAGVSASADTLPVAATWGFVMEGDMCGYMREAMEQRPRIVEARRGELLNERSRIVVCLELEKQALADINQQLDELDRKGVRR